MRFGRDGMTDPEVTCAHCDAAVRRLTGSASCGASLSEVRQVAIPRSDGHRTSRAPTAATVLL
jgi:hypothetical protein